MTDFNRYEAMKAAIALGDRVSLFGSTDGLMSEYRTPDGGEVAFRICQRCRREPEGQGCHGLCDDCGHEIGWERVCPPKFRRATWAAVEAAQPRTVVDAINAASGSVWLHGPPGTGKTFTALALLRERYDNNLATIGFVTAAHMLRDMRAHQLDENDRVDHYAGLDELVIDDLGAETLTEWAAERMLMVVNDRLEAERHAIVTTNWPPDELLPRVGERIWDRLHDGAVIVPVLGESRRRLAS